MYKNDPNLSPNTIEHIMLETAFSMSIFKSKGSPPFEWISAAKKSSSSLIFSSKEDLPTPKSFSVLSVNRFSIFQFLPCPERIPVRGTLAYFQVQYIGKRILLLGRGK